MAKQRSTRSAHRSKQKVQNKVPEENRGHAATLGLPVKDKTYYCGLARLQIIAALPNIVQGLIEKAAGGGYQQAKLLLELCDVTSIDSSHISLQHTQQLCDALLEGLQFPAKHSANSKSGHDAC